jgi:hypothetical protein
VHYAFATAIARDAVAHRGQPDDPLLARLLFEAMFDPRGVRMSSASLLLASSPYATEVARLLVEQRGLSPDEGSRASALRVAAFCHVDGDLPGAEELLDSADDIELVHGLTMLGRGGRPLPHSAVERGLTGDEMTVRRTLTCLGMAGDDRLAGLAQDPGRNADVRAGAGWWLAHGPRVTA